MEWLAEDPRTLFMGQAVAEKGTALTHSFKKVSRDRLIELPVCEEMQLGMATGLALEGYVPVTVYPRFNFLLLAMNQLVNHLDKLPEMSQGGYQPKVIIRTCIGSERPLNPQCQHLGDFTAAFRLLAKNVDVIRLDEPEEIFPAYQKALARTDGRSTLLAEFGDYYNDK